MAIRAKAFQPAKTKAIEEAKEVLQSYNDYIFADYRGLTVEQLSQLRKQLREKECEFKVVKNNFFNHLFLIFILKISCNSYHCCIICTVFKAWESNT